MGTPQQLNTRPRHRPGLSPWNLNPRSFPPTTRPGLVPRQQETERLRRLPDATMQEFHDAGILRVIQPAAFGGFEADFICQIDLTYEIVRSCGASGWVCAVLSAHAAMIANFSELAQHEVWGDDPCALASSSLSSIGSAPSPVAPARPRYRTKNFLGR